MRLLLLLVPAVAFADAPEVRLDAAATTIVDEIAKVDPLKAKVGETLTIATIAPLDTPGPIDVNALRNALAKAKLKTLGVHSENHRHVVTVEGAGGARARITVDQGGGRIFFTARPASRKLPGKCVTVPDVKHPVHVNSTSIGQDGETHSGRTFWDIKTGPVHDVDGDGIVDVFVPIAKRNACPETVSYRVFAMRGSCGHDLGVIGPGNFTWDAPTVALDASGFRPFVMESSTTDTNKSGVNVMVTTVRRFAFKQGKYTQVSSKTTRGDCHHCALWSCSSP